MKNERMKLLDLEIIAGLPRGLIGTIVLSLLLSVAIRSLTEYTAPLLTVFSVVYAVAWWIFFYREELERKKRIKMNYNDFLNNIIDDGIEAARADYNKNDEPKLNGSIAGFEACRNKQPEELLTLLTNARKTAGDLYFSEDIDKYWYARCFESEIEWVCNCISAATDQIITPPTVRGYLKAAEITNKNTLWCKACGKQKTWIQKMGGKICSSCRTILAQ